MVMPGGHEILHRLGVTQGGIIGAGPGPTTQCGIEGAVLAIEVAVTQPESDHAGAHPHTRWTELLLEHDILPAGRPHTGVIRLSGGRTHRSTVQGEYQNGRSVPEAFPHNDSWANAAVRKAAPGVEIRDGVCEISSVTLPIGSPFASCRPPRRQPLGPTP